MVDRVRRLALPWAATAAVLFGPDDLARHALAEAAGSFAPNTIVIGVDVERRTLLAHQLVPDPDPARSIDPLELG